MVPTVMLPMCAMITVTTSNTQNSIPSTRPLERKKIPIIAQKGYVERKGKYTGD